MASAKPSHERAKHTNDSWSHVEKFLAKCWHNLMTRDDVLNTQSAASEAAARKIKRCAAADAGEGEDLPLAIVETEQQQESSSQSAKRRGRPLSDLGWLPLGWERLTKTRSSGQRDTFYREMETNRMMRSAYDVTSYLEFGKVVRKGKERVKPVLEAKYGVKFPKERRETVLLLEPQENEVLALPGLPAGSVTEDPAADHHHHHQGDNLKAVKECPIEKNGILEPAENRFLSLPAPPGSTESPAADHIYSIWIRGEEE